jgi:hypothetical protein
MGPLGLKNELGFGLHYGAMTLKYWFTVILNPFKSL